jgi:hypothetical protein
MRTVLDQIHTNCTTLIGAISALEAAGTTYARLGEG